MERKNQEPVPQLDLEQALWKITEGEMLQFSSAGYKLFKYVDTRETQSRLMRVGESVHTYTIPIKEPVLQKEVSSLGELFNPEDRDNVRHVGKKIMSEEFFEWADNLVSPDDVIEAAYKSLIKDLILDDKYPKITLKNELTGEQRLIELDLAALVINGDVDVQSSGYESLHSDDLQIVERSLRFNVSAYIKQCLAEIGIDNRNAVKTCGEYVGKVDAERADVTGFRAYWQKRNGIVVEGTNSQPAKLTALGVLAAGQARLNSAYAWHRGSDNNCAAQEWSLRPVRPIQDVLEELRTTIAEAGYTLGFTQSITKTGDTGPAFFVLDRDGNIVIQLSSDPKIRESLEKACLKLQILR